MMSLIRILRFDCGVLFRRLLLVVFLSCGWYSCRVVPFVVLERLLLWT